MSLHESHKTPESQTSRESTQTCKTQCTASSKTQCTAASDETMSQHASRRGFIKGGSLMLAGGALGTALAAAKNVHAYGDDTLRIALIGCGRRGIQSTIAALSAESQFAESQGDEAAEIGGKSSLAVSHTPPVNPKVQLVAIADVFPGQVQAAYRTLKSRCPGQIDVEDRRFVGLDAYQSVMQTDADIVLLATPPAFRPLHFEMAIEARKHVVMEKPLGVDVAGVLQILETNENAKKRNLAVSAEFSHRFDPKYQDSIARIHEGMIGEPVFARAYCNAGPVRICSRRKNESELEFQLRNWNHFHWLGGDFISEQHVLGLDIINWVMRGHPKSAQGQGGWMTKDGSPGGQVFDHHSVEFDYPGMPRLLSQCRRAVGCWNSVSEHIHGTEGSADLAKGVLFDQNGDVIWKCDSKSARDESLVKHYQTYFAALRNGDRPNEIQQAADSTLTAILGRTATATGKITRWNDLLKSKHQFADVRGIQTLADEAPVCPDAKGNYAVSVPSVRRPRV